jgi:hypothetical protein
MDSAIRECETKFAPPDRANTTVLQNQYKIFINDTMLKDILDSAPDFTVILNSCRQIVFANKPLLDFLGGIEMITIVGKRPGELLSCSHSTGKNGCGTDEFCRVCGAVRAILTSQANIKDVQECTIVTADGEKTFNFRVWATPYERQHELFTIFTIRDIADEKYRASLEHIFFHDLVNTTSGIYGLLTMVADEPEQFKDYSIVMTKMAEQLLDEIGAQRDLMMVENNEIVMSPELVNSLTVINDIFNIYQKHLVADGKKLIIATDSAGIDFHSDPRLVRRVIGNMTKNALEASKTGDTVTMGCANYASGVRFYVNNQVYINRDIQLNLFKRSFSTKGSGRGWGTYSMKLLTEKYLHGSISFISDPNSGTTFYADYPIEVEK